MKDVERRERNVGSVEAETVKGEEMYGGKDDDGKMEQNNNRDKVPRKVQESFEKCSFIDAFYTYMCYAVLVIVGYINDLVRPRASVERNRV
ncbi:unnamed protein product, partial [Allacma fusca]